VHDRISDTELDRRLDRIITFERVLADDGALILKFWMHITPEEQLRRFRQRETVPYKRWKLTDEDWRNREKWDLYERAVQEMVERTSTFDASWTLVEGNCKRFARLKVLRTVADAIDGVLGPEKRKKRGRTKKK